MTGSHASQDVSLCSPALARTLERANADNAVAFALVRKALAPEAEIRVEEIGDGVAVTSGAHGGRTSSRAFALGTAAPVTVALIERVEAFFGDVRAPVISTCPLAHPSLFEALGARGFRIQEFDTVLCGAPVHRHGTSPVHVRALHADDVAVVARVVRGALGDADDSRMRLTTAPLMTPPSRTFAAFLDDEPVGIGTLCMVGDVALLLAGMTVQHARGRGVQRALIDARLDAAAHAGARLVTSRAAPGGTSERNLVRAGLRNMYTSVVFSKPQGGA